jgi:tRNA1(Val) A37 N6-methylase TrmN6
LILPEASFETVSGIASGLDLYLTRRTAVRSMEGKSPHRTLLEFSRKFETLSEDELILQKSLKRNDFSDSYMNLVRELYTTL